ncbi:MAG: HNH endonuclease [Bdellovibrionales bacterium]|nr:HNH endonuclease [Bdellovibrionales bacterium]
MNLKKLSNSELLNNTLKLSQTERETMVDLLLHLVEIDNRSLYLSEGYSSMFDYLIRELKLSSSAAGRRVKAIRILAVNPDSATMLRDGSLNLSTLCEAANAIKEDPKVINRFKGASKAKAQLIASEYKLAPKKKLKDSIKPLGRKVLELSLPITPASGSGGNRSLVGITHKIQFQAKDEFVEKLKEVKALLSNKYSAGITLEKVFTECMEVYLDKHSPTRRDVRRKKRKIKLVEAKKRTRNIPVDVRDQVFVRDENQCTYISENGIRCCSTYNLQVDHIKPYALGGSNELSNLRILCAKHNRLEAMRFFPECYLKPKVA